MAEYRIIIEVPETSNENPIASTGGSGNESPQNPAKISSSSAVSGLSKMAIGTASALAVSYLMSRVNNYVSNVELRTGNSEMQDRWNTGLDIVKSGITYIGGGAIAGATVGGPIGAVVGAVIGAVAGHISYAIKEDNFQRTRELNKTINNIEISSLNRRAGVSTSKSRSN